MDPKKNSLFLGINLLAIYPLKFDYHLIRHNCSDMDVVEFGVFDIFNHKIMGIKKNRNVRSQTHPQIGNNYYFSQFNALF